MKARKLTSTGLVAVLVTALLVAGVIASASGATKQLIHACVDDQTGALTIAHNGEGCGPHGHALNWDGNGRQGPQGPPGPPGDPGDLDLEIVTKSASFGVAAGDVAANGIGFGVGVDCPGSTLATGGGGSAYWTFDIGPNAPSISTEPVPLTSTFPLENHSTGDPADTGDTPTGWWAAASSLILTSPQGAEGPQATSTVTVTVWASCEATPLNGL